MRVAVFWLSADRAQAMLLLVFVAILLNANAVRSLHRAIADFVVAFLRRISLAADGRAAGLAKAVAVHASVVPGFAKGELVNRKRCFAPTALLVASVFTLLVGSSRKAWFQLGAGLARLADANMAAVVVACEFGGWFADEALAAFDKMGLHRDSVKVLVPSHGC